MKANKSERAALTELLESGDYDLNDLVDEVFTLCYKLLQQRSTLCAVAVKSNSDSSAPVWFFGPYINKVEANKAAGLFAHAGSRVEVGSLRSPIGEKE